MSIASVAAAGSAVLTQQIQKLQQAVPAEQTGMVRGHHHGGHKAPALPAAAQTAASTAGSTASSTASSLLDLLA
ncbi:hypothetical protein [Lichenicoccus sp.]|uniref:hypothetical protein n=1 Tax=Lichenicoccus sp. TaxID=2781899 RepID=UPI003D0ACBE4